MKKFILTSAILIATTIAAIASPRIVLEDKQENYTQTETGYSLHFKLIATGEEFVSIMNEVQNYSDRLVMNVSEGTAGTYDCIFVVNHQNQPEYVHKMLVAIGIADLEYKGNVQNLDTIVAILKSYL